MQKANCIFYPSINWISYYGLFVFYLQGDLSERSVIFLRCLYRVFLLFIAIAATIPKDASSKRNYFIINPTFERNFLAYSLILAVAVLIGFYFERANVFSYIDYGKLYCFCICTDSSYNRTNAKQRFN